MHGLPIALFAFAAGATWLQWRGVLPSGTPWLGAAALAAILAVGMHGVCAFARSGALARPCIVALAALLAATAAGAFGFGYAAWRAEIRLADELPHEWEGVDITVVGVIDELPQSSGRGTRFAFAVERIETS